VAAAAVGQETYQDRGLFVNYLEIRDPYVNIRVQYVNSRIAIANRNPNWELYVNT
jgi:hypothetical protein